MLTKTYEKREYDLFNRKISNDTEGNFMARDSSNGNLRATIVQYSPVTDQQIEKIITIFYASSNTTKFYNA